MNYWTLSILSLVRKKINRGKAMSDDKKGERKGIRLNEDHERGGNSGFQVEVAKY